MEGAQQPQGLSTYYRAKTEELELRIRDKAHNLRRLEAQRNELNTQGPCRHMKLRPQLGWAKRMIRMTRKWIGIQLEMVIG